MRQQDSEAPGGLSHAAKWLLAILGYYVTMGVAITVAWRLSPSFRELLSGAPLRDLAVSFGSVLTRSDLANAAEQAVPVAPLQQASATLTALVAALAMALPVGWTYSMARRRKGYEQSMVHTLILLPVAVAGMVMLIQNSLALAFSLAGIVAVLRFRNTLEDAKDGVYVFICVGIGMSAAVGALAIGLVTSVVFNASVLTLWWIDFARRPTPGLRGGVRRLMRLPKLTPHRVEATRGERADGQLGDEVFASAARAWRRQLQITAEHQAVVIDDRFNATLRVQTTTPDASRPLIEELLRAKTRRFELMGVTPDGANFTLKYQIRVRRADRSELLEAMRQLPQTVGVELG
jgi:hypothetical protein